MPVRIDLDSMNTPQRKAIDADWSPAKKKAVGISAAVLSVAVVAAGAWWMVRLLPVSMPKTAQEAVAVMNSSKWSSLDEARKRDYSEEAWRLINQMPEADRMAMLRGKENEEARRNLMMERMAENARKFARGQEIEMPWGRGGPGGQGQGQGRPGGQGGPDGQQRPPEDDKSREERRQAFVGRIQEGIQTGNAQNMGLMGEMRKRMAAQRAAGGGASGGGGRGR